MDTSLFSCSEEVLKERNVDVCAGILQCTEWEINFRLIHSNKFQDYIYIYVDTIYSYYMILIIDYKADEINFTNPVALLLVILKNLRNKYRFMITITMIMITTIFIQCMETLTVQY